MRQIRRLCGVILLVISACSVLGLVVYPGDLTTFGQILAIGTPIAGLALVIS